VGHSSKNLLKLESSTQTTAGITYTVNKSNGTVTANGTVTTGQNSYYNIAMDLPEGNYYFYGCPTGGSNSKYDIFPWDNTTAARPKQWDGTTEAVPDYDMTPKQFKVIAGHSLRLSIRIRSGQTVNNLVFKPMVWDGSIADDTFEPGVIPTDEAKQDKPVMLYDAGESSVGVHSVTGLSNLTQYSELHITLFSPLNGDNPNEGIMHTIVCPFIFPYNPEHHMSLFDCWIMALIDKAFEFKRIGIYVSTTNTKVTISSEIDEQTGEPIHIPSNHYIYIKRIVGIP
jgi:hypothetical protein